MKSKPHKGSLAACTSSLFLLGMLIWPGTQKKTINVNAL
jgi:hypothetical protein